MTKRNLKKSLISVYIVIFILFSSFAVSANEVFADGGSIAMAKTYPEDGGTYGVIDHFLYQVTAINTNTTVSVSIDNGPLLPMDYEGIRNEKAPDDTITRDWYTWQTTTPAITTSACNTFQFFSHYYVWQDADHYWAEFNACSIVRSFTLAGSSSTPSQSLTPTTLNQVNILEVLTTSPLATILLIIFFVTQKFTQWVSFGYS